MIRLPPRSTRTDTLFPYTTLFRSGVTATIITDSDGARLVLKGGVGEDAAFTLTNGGGADANLARFTWDGSTGGMSQVRAAQRSEEHTSELQSLMRISYAVFCLKKKKSQGTKDTDTQPHARNK